MKIISIYALSRQSNAKKLIEKWVLQDDGRAVLTFCNDSEPLYPSCEGARPSDGKTYINNLLHVLSKSSHLDAVVE